MCHKAEHAFLTINTIHLIFHWGIFHWGCSQLPSPLTPYTPLKHTHGMSLHLTHKPLGYCWRPYMRYSTSSLPTSNLPVIIKQFNLQRFLMGLQFARYMKINKKVKNIKN